MKPFIILTLFIMILPVTLGVSLDTVISISHNDIVTETIKVKFHANESYDSFSFTSLSEPLNILYEGGYIIEEIDDSYVITFQKMIKPGTNELTFSLLYDDLVDRKGSNRVFRTGFSSELADEIFVTLNLPSSYVLADQAPQASPKPDKILTDGQRIKLEWRFTDDSVIAVFYKGQVNLVNYFIGGILIMILVTICIFLYLNQRFNTIVKETLSEDEQLVVKELSKGVTIQKVIAFNLNFSKSKMSKVIRKLEEKGLIEKVPHFKTNKIKLKKIK